MAAAADEALDTVRPGEAFDGYQLFRGAIRRSTIRSLFGADLAERAEEIGRMLQPLLDLIDLNPTVAEAHRRARTPLWRRARAARHGLDELVFEEIAQARRGPVDARMLSVLVHGRDGSGSGLSDLELRDQVVSLIAAGYETTSAAMGWVLHGLGQRPDLMIAAREESLAVSEPGTAGLDALPLVQAIVTEALRLWPPAAVSARYVRTAFELDGHLLRARTTLLYSPYVTHRSARVYADPLRFRPERWLAGDKRATSEFLPFGGGAHRCIGSRLATTELAVMLSRLLARGTFETRPGRVRAVSLAAMRPRDGVHLRILPT